MHITRLSLSNYRNYNRLQQGFGRGSILLQGQNAQGKTNLLEAIYYLSTTTSPHARSDRQLLNWLALDNEVMPYFRLEAEVQRQSGLLTVTITLVQEGNRYKKDMRLNQSQKRAKDIIGKLNTVMFLPEDIALVTGSPSVRRRYLDSMLCQIDPDYYHALSQFNKIITQRNALLKELGERRRSVDQLAYWDEELTTHGATVVIRRHNALLDLDAVARQRHRVLSDGREGLRLYYAPSFDPHDQPHPDFQLPLGLNELGPRLIPAPPHKTVVETYRQQLQHRRRAEIERGVTLLGPHRDDFHFLVDGVDLNLYGSRGQQRTAALSTKLAEVDLMHQHTGEPPVLLLDDVMSELDAQRRSQVLELLDRGQQAFVTTTDWADYSPDFIEQAHCFQVIDGQLKAYLPSPKAS